MKAADGRTKKKIVHYLMSNHHVYNYSIEYTRGNKLHLCTGYE